jgi:quercetin dioxygenase-like cupin family protein
VLARPYFFTRTVAFVVILFAVILAAAQSQPKPRAKVVALDKSDSGVIPILTGPPETVTMKSGYVVLEPGQSVGKHSTEHHEEILIVLEGQGEMRFQDGSKLELKARTALYCPPETEHDVKSTGAAPLRYVYVVASAQ